MVAAWKLSLLTSVAVDCLIAVVLNSIAEDWFIGNQSESISFHKPQIKLNQQPQLNYASAFASFSSEFSLFLGIEFKIDFPAQSNSNPPWERNQTYN